MAMLNDVIIDTRNRRIRSLEDFKDELSCDLKTDETSEIYFTFCEYINDYYSAGEVFSMDEDEKEVLIEDFLYHYIQNINSYDGEIFFMNTCYLNVKVND